jgi:hypothetical protein
MAERRSFCGYEEDSVNPERAFSFSEPKVESVKEPGAGPTANFDRLAEKMRSLEQWYAADFERRVASITEMLKQQISEELRAQFNTEVESRTERLREQFEERLYTRVGEWQSQQASLEREIEELRRKVPSKNLQDEIASVEAAMARYTTAGTPGFDSQPADPASLSRMLQTKVEEMEMRAYLRGLRFRTA